MNRQVQLSRLHQETFDLCIIGGGASGAGCALDAALRGLKVALVEKSDFASETSSKSTKLIHGGVRYLEQAFKELDLGQLRQVRHGLQERQILLSIAPHLTHPLALLTPVEHKWEGLYYSAGLRLYDLFAAKNNRLPSSRWLGRKEMLHRKPMLSPRLQGAVLYYDGQLDDARFCLGLIQGAVEAGAAVTNYTELTGFEKATDSGPLKSALVRDIFSGRTFPVRAKVFLNCTGVFADQIRQMANPGLLPRIRPSKGVHIMLPEEVIGPGEAILIPKTADGRVVFAIPFAGGTLLGTTDQDYDHPGEEPTLESSEVDFLLGALQPYLSEKLDRSRVRAGFGGLRPLLAAADEGGTKSLVRDHEVEYDAGSNLFSLLGGKWTTYRLMAKDAVDAVDSHLKAPRRCMTATHPLPGAQGYHRELWKELQQQYGWEEAVCRHLCHSYGARAAEVAALTQSQPALAEKLHPAYPHIAAQVVYAAKVEMACTVRDVLARRLRLEISDWAAAQSVAPQVADLIGSVLNWSAERCRKEAADYVQMIGYWMIKSGVNTGQSLL